MESLKFTVPEMLSIAGVVQCVYILVYMAFRAGRLSRAGLAIIYFSCLGIAFALDFAQNRLGGALPYYRFLQWFAWFSGPPLGALLVLQIAQITQTPSPRFYLILLFVPAAFVISWLGAYASGDCGAIFSCPLFYDWLNLSGVVAGALSLLILWLSRGLLEGLTAQKTGKERYWLILALIVANVGFLVIALAGFSDHFSAGAPLARALAGLGLVYLAITSLFRIYPQAVIVSLGRADSLSEEEKTLALKIERLVDMDKVYHEAAYSRSDLARELGEAESAISRIINVHFGKSFPQLLNERRIEDAKRLLLETNANIKTIAEEVGFNSLASFNRVFKELSGIAPSAYRKQKKS